jgi:hypothetical protein
MIQNRTGSPVEGLDFYGREKELEFAWKKIESGNSLILSAPRRVGKSSFAKKLLNKAESKGWNTIEINLEEVSSEEGFVKLFIERLEQRNWWSQFKNRNGARISQLLESLNGTVDLVGLGTLTWGARKEDVYEKLKQLMDYQQETLIMVDELTVLLSHLIESDTENGKNNVKFFLNWLRSFRQKTGTKIRWVFCSSVGIDNFMSIHSLSHSMNDIDSFPLGPFNEIKAKTFLMELSSSHDLPMEDIHIQYCIDKLGWCLPFFIQLLFSNVNRLVSVEEKVCSIDTIDEAYQALIGDKHLNTWDERLAEYGDFMPYARLLLTGLCKVKEGESRNALLARLSERITDPDEANMIFSKVMNMLRNDGYLDVSEEGKYVFRSALLRGFWFNRFAI